MSALLLALSLSAGAAVPVDLGVARDTARSLDAAGLAVASRSDDWVQALGAQVVQAEAEAPAVVAAIASLEPNRTRAGSWRFTAPIVHETHATAPLLVRLIEGSDGPELRVALVDAVKRSGGSWHAPIAAMATIETDAAVRRMLVEVLDKVPLSMAREPLVAGLHDLDASVRAAAVRAVGGNAEGAILGGELVSLVADNSVEVRVEACRSLGWLEVSAGWAALVRATTDPEAEVRLRALRALQRIDAGRAAQLSAVRTAAGDSDAKVARAARQILGE